jgi:predicted phosphodiesterase
MIGVLSDAHGNLAGFLKAVALLERLGARRYVFLGDAVGYVPCWGVVDELARRRDSFTFIRGNHEDALLSGICTGKDHVYQHGALHKDLTVERAAFLRSWHTSLTLRLPCGDAMLVHGSPTDPQNGYLYPDTPLGDLDIKEPFLFCGHTHRPFVQNNGKTCVVNVGSCGLPRDDGRYGSAALLDDESGDIEIVRYELDPESTAYLSRFDRLHPSVSNLFARRADGYFGKLYV